MTPYKAWDVFRLHGDGVEHEIDNSDWTISEADLKGALKNEQAGDKSEGKKADNKKSDKEKDDTKDYQLVRALDLVKALYLYGQNDNKHFIKQEEETPKKSEK